MAIPCRPVVSVNKQHGALLYFVRWAHQGWAAQHLEVCRGDVKRDIEAMSEDSRNVLYTGK